MDERHIETTRIEILNIRHSVDRALEEVRDWETRRLLCQVQVYLQEALLVLGCGETVSS